MNAENIKVERRDIPLTNPPKFSHIALNINGEEVEVPIKFLRVGEMKTLEKLLQKCFDLGREAEREACGLPKLRGCGKDDGCLDCLSAERSK